MVFDCECNEKPGYHFYQIPFIPLKQVEKLSSCFKHEYVSSLIVPGLPCDHGLHPQPHLGPAPVVHSQQDRGRQWTVCAVLRVA